MLLTLFVATLCLVTGTLFVVADNICSSTDSTLSHQLVTLPGGQKGQILCDTNGGGWVVMQRRRKGDVLFNQTWRSYVDGFGSVKGDFWIGLQNIHKLCPTNCTFRVDLGYRGFEYFSEYRGFSVSGEADYFRLTLQAKIAGNTSEDDLMAGEEGGMLSVHKMQFSTIDVDNDKNVGSCSIDNGYGGWWWNGQHCGDTNPNGQWRSISSGEAMFWKSVTGGFKYSVTFTELKLGVGPGVDWTTLDTTPINPVESTTTLRPTTPKPLPPVTSPGVSGTPTTTTTTNTALATTATSGGITTTFISDATMTALAAFTFLFIFVNF